MDGLAKKSILTWADLPADLSRLLRETERSYPVVGTFCLVFLHECGGVSKLRIWADGHQWSEPHAYPSRWSEVEDVSHSYCCGCSDAPAPGGSQTQTRPKQTHREDSERQVIENKGGNDDQN